MRSNGSRSKIKSGLNYHRWNRHKRENIEREFPWNVWNRLSMDILCRLSFKLCTLACLFGWGGHLYIVWEGIKEDHCKKFFTSLTAYLHHIYPDHCFLSLFIIILIHYLTITITYIYILHLNIKTMADLDKWLEQAWDCKPIT
jgi:hypothetical protein